MTRQAARHPGSHKGTFPGGKKWVEQGRARVQCRKMMGWIDDKGGKRSSLMTRQAARPPGSCKGTCPGGRKGKGERKWWVEEEEEHEVGRARARGAGRVGAN